MDRLYYIRHRNADVLKFPGPFLQTVRSLAPGTPHFIEHQMGEISKSLVHSWRVERNQIPGTQITGFCCTGRQAPGV